MTREDVPTRLMLSLAVGLVVGCATSMGWGLAAMLLCDALLIGAARVWGRP